MYEQSMVQSGTPKKAQKRSAPQLSIPASQTDEVKTKKAKEQGEGLSTPIYLARQTRFGAGVSYWGWIISGDKHHHIS